MTAKRFVLAIDQGTTGSAALLVDHDLRVLGRAKREYPQIYPRPGWVEHNPEDIWQSTMASVREVLSGSGVSPKEIAAIGITNQRETSLLWDRETGKPVHNAIVWQCRRTADLCTQLKNEGLEQEFRSRTGLVLDPYFSGTKVRWMLENVRGLRQRAESGEIAFGTVDAFLLWRLTGGKVHGTDVSNASRTLMLNLRTLDWDPELLGHLGIPFEVLPQVLDSSSVYGVTSGVDGLPDEIPIASLIGDQQAALFGQGAFDAGQAKCTYGTGAFLLLNTGEAPVPSSHGLLTTVGWRIHGKTTYALEGSSFIAGAAVQWLRDELKIIAKSEEVEELAKTVPDAGGCVFVPALAGLGAPHWDPEARGAFLGISRGTNRGHLARAVLDGIALQIVDLVQAMEADAKRPLGDLRVDGGATANDLLMQRQADLLGVPVVRPRMAETTSLGAALLAGLAVEFWTDLTALREAIAVERTFAPGLGAAERDRERWAWRAAVGAVRAMAKGVRKGSA
jgi:glycerol kinase